MHEKPDKNYESLTNAIVLMSIDRLSEFGDTAAREALDKLRPFLEDEPHKSILETLKYVGEILGAEVERDISEGLNAAWQSFSSSVVEKYDLRQRAIPLGALNDARFCKQISNHARRIWGYDPGSGEVNIYWGSKEIEERTFGRNAEFEDSLTLIGPEHFENGFLNFDSAFAMVFELDSRSDVLEESTHELLTRKIQELKGNEFELPDIDFSQL